MILTIDELVKLLRDSVNVQNSTLPILDENGEPILDDEGNKQYGVVDKAYLDMTDEDLILYIKLGCSRAFQDITDLVDLEAGSEYPILTLAKIELYMKLATIKANDIDLTADNNNQLKQSQRFAHYMKLVAELKDLYNTWLENESISNNEVNSYNVLLHNRHYTKRNYELAPTPKVKISLDNITNDCVEFSWTLTNTSHFGRYKVYISENPIMDMYKEGTKAEDKINKDVLLIKNTTDIRNTTHRINGLKPETLYYIAVVAIERNLVFGFRETSFTTLEAFEENEEDVEIDNISGD